MISPTWIKAVSREDSKVPVDLRRAEVEAAPKYDPSVPMERTYEARLYVHYRRPTYWDEESQER